MNTKLSVGVLGIQGDIEENKTVAQEALNHSNVKGDVKFVRYAEEIEKIDGLILPGGESTVISTSCHNTGRNTSYNQAAYS